MTGRHLAAALVVMAGVATFFAGRGVNTLASGVGFVLIVCPIAMGAAMWLLSRSPRTTVVHAETPRHAPTRTLQ